MRGSVAIVMSGVPASGKTSLGRELALRLDWPFLDKDDFLEKSFEEAPVGNMQDRRRLSRMSDAQFRDAAKTRNKAVLVSHWTPKSGPADTGTPSGWVAQNFAQVIEIYCECRVELAIRRFLGRTRHSGHLDQERSREDIERQLRVLEGGYPLGLGVTISTNTETRPDVETLCRQIAKETVNFRSP